MIYEQVQAYLIEFELLIVYKISRRLNMNRHEIKPFKLFILCKTTVMVSVMYTKNRLLKDIGNKK